MASKSGSNIHNQYCLWHQPFWCSSLQRTPNNLKILVCSCNCLVGNGSSLPFLGVQQNGQARTQCSLCHWNSSSCQVRTTHRQCQHHLLAKFLWDRGCNLLHLCLLQKFLGCKANMLYHRRSTCQLHTNHIFHLPCCNDFPPGRREAATATTSKCCPL